MRKDKTLIENRKQYVKERLSRVKNKTREMQLIADDLFLDYETIRKIAEKIEE